MDNLSIGQFSLFEQKVFKSLKQTLPPQSHLLAAVSGGADSMALLTVLNRLKDQLKISVLKVLHIHHGNSSNVYYRDQVKSLTAEYCLRLKISWTCIQNQEEALTSEEDLRHFRLKSLVNSRDSLGNNYFILTGHQKDDDLENQFLRLWRGTGVEGLVSFQKKEGFWIRPLLDISKTEILEYCEQRSVPFLNDPTNLQSDATRNFIRNELFPRMESFRPGGLNALAKSLDILKTENYKLREELLTFVEYANGAFSRIKLSMLSTHETGVLVAYLLNIAGYHDFTSGLVFELAKQVNRLQNEFEIRFKINGQIKVWRVDAKHVKVIESDAF